jgi:hypothetical protein
MAVRLNNVRLAFPALWEPKAFAGNEGAAKFGASLLIKKTDKAQVDKVKQVMMEVAHAKWNDKAKSILELLMSQGRTCLRDGDQKSEYDGFDGCVYLSTSAAAKPLIIGQDKQPLEQSSGLPYAGSFVNASVEIWAQDNKFGKRINATLRGVQFAGHGDAFSGSAPASTDEFDALETKAEDSGDLLGF